MKPGDVLGRYEVLSLLARGGMAEVWRARIKGESGFRKDLVLKSILPHLAEDPEFEGMFINEALLAARLNHPNVVQIFDLGQVAGQFFIAMEFVPGHSLRQISRALKKRRRAMPPWFLLRSIVDVCEGLQYAHDLTDDDGSPLNIVHRDISPENVMVSRAGLVKVLDFGVAKATTTASSTQAGALKGKYAYIPPEQIQGQQVDRRTDVYAVGVMLYEMLCGRRPYRGDNELQLLKAVLDSKPTPPSELAKWIPSDLEEIIHKAMHPDREQRFANTQQLGDQLRLFISRRLRDQHSQRHMGQLVTVLFSEDSEKKASPDAEVKAPAQAAPAASPPTSSDDEEIDVEVIDLSSGDIVRETDHNPAALPKLATGQHETETLVLSPQHKAHAQAAEQTADDDHSPDKKDSEDDELSSSLLDFAESEELFATDRAAPPSTLGFLQAEPGSAPSPSSAQAQDDVDAKQAVFQASTPKQADAQAIPDPNVDSIAQSPERSTPAGGNTPPAWLRTPGSDQRSFEKTPSWLSTTTRATIVGEKRPSWLTTSDQTRPTDKTEPTPTWLTPSRELRGPKTKSNPGGWPFANPTRADTSDGPAPEIRLPLREPAPSETSEAIPADNKRPEAERFFAQGLSLMRENREAEAIAKWERAIELDPGNRRYAFNLRRIKEK